MKSSRVVLFALAIVVCRLQGVPQAAPNATAAPGHTEAIVATKLTPGQITRGAVHRRAVEAVNWGMLAVNFDLMYQAAIRIGSHDNQIVYWSRLPNWKSNRSVRSPATARTIEVSPRPLAAREGKR